MNVSAETIRLQSSPRLTGQATTDGSRSTLRHVQRGQGRGRADAESCDESADVHDSQGTVHSRCGLQDDADRGDSPGHHETQPSTVLVGQPGGEEAGSKASGLQRRDDVLVQVGPNVLGLAKGAERLHGRRHGQHAADGSRVPSEKHAAKAGGAHEGEDPPSVNLLGVGAHRIVAHDGPQDLGHDRHAGRLSPPAGEPVRFETGTWKAEARRGWCRVRRDCSPAPTACDERWRWIGREN